jgi:antitoxin component YwqK of YwqJK toxin-antitoxin module
MRLLLGFLICHFFSAQILAQCEFKYHQKKGGHYLFSTFYEDDWKTPKEGVCEISYNGMVYERRVFRHGRLIEERLRYPDGSPHVESVFHDLNRRDSVFIDQKVWAENRSLSQHDIYYRDHSGRRCLHQQGFHMNGKLRFDRFFAFVRKDELNEYQVKDHPDHVVDEEGYTTLMAPIGPERWYDESGAIVWLKTHRPILLEGMPYTYSLPLEYSLHGPSIEYHSNGRIRKSSNYVNGRLDGISMEFDYNGVKISEGVYSDGVQDSIWLSWYDDGSLHSRYVYDVRGPHPFHPEKQEWWPNGQLKLEEKLDAEGTGLLQEWSASGQLTHRLDILRLQRDKGRDIYWFENGQIHIQYDFRASADTLALEYYNDAGDLKCLRTRRMEDRRLEVLNQLQYYPNGTLQREVEKRTPIPGILDADWKMSELTYDDKGVLLHSIFTSSREMFEELYHRSGTKVKSRHVLDGQLDGVFEELDTLGHLLLKYRYTSGVRHGACSRYDAMGKLLYEEIYDSGRPSTHSLSEWEERVRQGLPRNTLTWSERVMELGCVFLDSTLQDEENKKRAVIYLARLFQALEEPGWMDELADMSEDKRDWERPRGNVRFVMKRSDSGVWNIDVAGQGQSLYLRVYADGEVEEQQLRMTLSELRNFTWTEYPKMWDD